MRSCHLMAGAAVLLSLACSSQPHPVMVGSPPEGELPANGLSNIQGLFRVHYDGPEGSGRLRLVLKSASAAHFQLQSADTLGRALWSLDVGDQGSLLIDHRQETFCETDGELRLKEQTLGVLSLRHLPSVLLGRLPEDVSHRWATDQSEEITDSVGRRWRIRSKRDGVVAWTLWVEGTPTLWWTRQAKGGILSHRDGSQFRWREVVVEPLSSGLESLVIPSDFRRVACHEYDLPELREDQPESAGSG